MCESRHNSNRMRMIRLSSFTTRQRFFFSEIRSHRDEMRWDSGYLIGKTPDLLSDWMFLSGGQWCWGLLRAGVCDHRWFFEEWKLKFGVSVLIKVVVTTQDNRLSVFLLCSKVIPAHRRCEHCSDLFRVIIQTCAHICFRPVVVWQLDLSSLLNRVLVEEDLLPLSDLSAETLLQMVCVAHLFKGPDVFWMHVASFSLPTRRPFSTSRTEHPHPSLLRPDVGGFKDKLHLYNNWKCRVEDNYHSSLWTVYVTWSRIIDKEDFTKVKFSSSAHRHL